MTITLTMKDQLVDLGSLVDNEEVAPMRVGARLVESFFDSFNKNHEVDEETIGNILYFLTDIQVRDYALGLMNPAKFDKIKPALDLLVELAPADSIYINAPASLRALVDYEEGNTPAALVMLSTASDTYSLAQLLRRVFVANWPKESFQQMRNELHSKVAEGIFGDEAA